MRTPALPRREHEQLPDMSDTPDWVADARDALVADGDYIGFERDDRVNVVPLQDGWTRVGRSLSAHVRFDDPTVSRRHALIHRDGSGVRVLDDRSLNGVFLNGERVDWHELEDGDQIAIGAFRLFFMSVRDRSRAGASLKLAPGA